MHCRSRRVPSTMHSQVALLRTRNNNHEDVLHILAPANDALRYFKLSAIQCDAHIEIPSAAAPNQAVVF